jgi:hypothetical protein
MTAVAGQPLDNAAPGAARRDDRQGWWAARLGRKPSGARHSGPALGLRRGLGSVTYGARHIRCTRLLCVFSIEIGSLGGGAPYVTRGGVKVRPEGSLGARGGRHIRSTRLLGPRRFWDFGGGVVNPWVALEDFLMSSPRAGRGQSVAMYIPRVAESSAGRSGWSAVRPAVRPASPPMSGRPGRQPKAPTQLATSCSFCMRKPTTEPAPCGDTLKCAENA